MAREETMQAGEAQPAPVPAPEVRWTRGDWAAVVLFFVIGMVVVVLRETSFFKGTPGDVADPRFNSVVLEHVYRWFTGQAGSLWDPSFFYPFTGVLAFSDNHFGSAPFYIALRLLGLDRYAAFSGWFVIGSALNYVACCYLLRKLGFSALAAATGAFLYSFSLPVTAQVGHAQLTYRFAVPLAMAALLNLYEGRDLRSLGWLAFWVAVQFYCTIYIGVFLVLLVAGWTLGAYAAGWRQRRSEPLPHRAVFQSVVASTTETRLAVAALCALSILALAYLLGTYEAVAAKYGFHRDYVEIATMLPRFVSYFQAEHSMLWDRLIAPYYRPPMVWEHYLFVGFAAYLLFVLGIALQWGRLVLKALVAYALLVIATFSLFDHSLYWFLFALPGFNSIRAVTRIWFVEVIPFAIIVAAAVDGLGRRKATAATVSVLLLVVLVLVESVTFKANTTSRRVLEDRITSLRTQLPAKLPPDAILFVALPLDKPAARGAIDAMILAQDLGLPTLNGYSGNQPPGNDWRQTNGCGAGADLLSGYVHIEHLDEAAFQALAARVVPIGFATCDPKAWRLS
jgi:hypothetical protein